MEAAMEVKHGARGDKGPEARPDHMPVGRVGGGKAKACYEGRGDGDGGHHGGRHGGEAQGHTPVGRVGGGKSACQRQVQRPSPKPGAQLQKEDVRPLPAEPGSRQGTPAKAPDVAVAEPMSESLGERLQHELGLRTLLERGRDAPEQYADSLTNLAQYLVAPAKTDEQRAWVIFVWVCHHIDYDIDGLMGRAPWQATGAEGVLVSRKSVCAGYAGIFAKLASSAGLVVKTISGHARSWNHSVGQDVTKGLGHSWNAVKLGGAWVLVDSCWGAGNCTSIEFLRCFKPHYFGTPPGQLAFSHFPEEPSWQLLERPQSDQDFIGRPIVDGKSFFVSGLRFPPVRFPPGACPDGTIRGHSFQLVVPVTASLLVELGDKEVQCDQQRDEETGVVTFRCKELKDATPGSTLKVHVLTTPVYYESACKFRVQGRQWAKM